MSLEINLSDLDPNNPGDWPFPIQLIALLFLCIVVWVAGFYLDTSDQLTRLESVERKEAELKATFEKKQARAANLEQYQEQIEEMKQNLGAMLRQLPNKTEVANLLVDVSQTGLGAGLKFELFDPQAEISRDFYAELPIQLTVTGDYHQFGEFVSGLAALPRIVTIHDIRISPNGETLRMSATARTYRYYEQEEDR